MAARPPISVLCSWIATVGILATAALVARTPRTEPRTIVHSVLPTSASLVTTTTTAPSTTTTTTAPPPPPTTVAPPPTTAPRPTTTTAAPPVTAAPVSVAHDPTPAATPEYAMSVLGGVIPTRWLAAVPVHVLVIAGSTSYSSWGGLIEIGEWHLTSTLARARNVLTHEWGHHVAWLYGTDAYNGAPPAGFPYTGRAPQEQWADCVAETFTGTSYPTDGLGPCPGDALAFTASFFAWAPGPRLRG